jgi:putative oxidoreductase
MINNIVKTDNNSASLILRIILGLVFIPHGAQKLLGWFGGYGFSGTMAYFTDTMGLPWLIALAVILIEFFGGIFLLLGLFSRLDAFLISALMIGAVATTHAQNGIFMNWFGNQKGEGFEYHLLVIAISAGLIILGSGKWSVDRLLQKNNSGKKIPEPNYGLKNRVKEAHL